MISPKKVILWFRQDLRLHDNEALTEALEHGDELIPVYIFDERVFKGKTRDFGLPKTDKFRAQFIIEAIQDLRESFLQRGSNLIVRVGKPEEILFEMAREYNTSWIFCNRERTQEEEKVQDALEEKLWSVGQEIRYSRGKMLYYTADLPFPVTHTPDVFTHFRKEVEKYVKIRATLPTPGDVKPSLHNIEAGEIPTIADFGHEPIDFEPRAAIQFKGGETAAIQRLEHYLWETDAVAEYFETRNGLLGEDYSTKFSPWLAQGCISPKLIYQEVERYQQKRTKNKSTYWVIFELLWRDFFRLMAKKNGSTIFQKGGPKGEVDPSWRDDMRLFNIWREGRTGIPFIDANMREIAATGFMSNRGRQNVASFLVKDLHVNWQMGAEYFESILLDYDPASNWGNWNYIAGVGSDPRENRYFNILSQAKRYDAQGEYVKHWLPELENVPREKVHRPDTLSSDEQGDFGVKLGAQYPKSMVNMTKWAK